MIHGWWKIQFEGVKRLDAASLEHIARLVKEGYREGQIMQEEEEEEEEEEAT